MFRNVFKRFAVNSNTTTKSAPHRFTRRSASSHHHHQHARHHFETMGDRPKYFEEAQQETKGKFGPFIFVMLALPMIFVPLYTDYWIQHDIKNGDPLLTEFEEYRKERNAKLAKKRELKVTSLNNKTSENEQYFKYVLIGGGTSSYYAYKAIRENDPDGTILILSEENYSPYQRPPLSKEMWQSSESDASNLVFTAWNGKKVHVEYEPSSASGSDNNNNMYSGAKNVTLLTGSKVVDIDVINQTVSLANGQSFAYDKCLLGTGGTPREIPGSEALPKDRISTFRSLDDFKHVYDMSRSGANIVVVGGSWLGTELSYALGSHKMSQQQKTQKSGGTTTTDAGSVVQVYLEPEVLARNLPRYLSESVRATLQSVGVQLKPNRNVVKVSLEKRPRPNGDQLEDKVIVTLDNGEELVTDFVLTATGIFPNTELAENAGLEIDPVNGGIVTNAELEARQNVFVAGDVLSYYDVVLGRRRYEHYEHATATGRHAGLNMSSSSNMKPFRHVSMFWSDIGKDISFQAVGEIKSELDTYSVWDGVSISQNGTPWNNAPAPLKNESFKRGVVYYLRDRRVVGILLWNVHDDRVMKEARKVILDKKKYDNMSELRDLINIKKE